MFHIQSLGFASEILSYKRLNNFDCAFFTNIEDFPKKGNQALAFSKRTNLKTFLKGTCCSLYDSIVTLFKYLKKQIWFKAAA